MLAPRSGVRNPCAMLSRAERRATDLAPASTKGAHVTAGMKMQRKRTQSAMVVRAGLLLSMLASGCQMATMSARLAPLDARPTRYPVGPTLRVELDRPMAVGDEFELQVQMQRWRWVMGELRGQSLTHQQHSQWSTAGHAKVVAVDDDAVRELAMTVREAAMTVDGVASDIGLRPGLELRIRNTEQRGMLVTAARYPRWAASRQIVEFFEGHVLFEGLTSSFGARVERRQGELWQVGLGVDSLTAEGEQMRRPMPRYAAINWLREYMGVPSFSLQTWADGAELEVLVPSTGLPLRQRTVTDRTVIVPVSRELPFSECDEEWRVDQREYRAPNADQPFGTPNYIRLETTEVERRSTTVMGYVPASRISAPVPERPTTADPDSTG